jgi:DNA-binding FadR family transcriptional regulator
MPVVSPLRIGVVDTRGMNAQSGRTGNLVQQTVHRIAAYIRDEMLRVGDQLPSEGALGERLCVSRTVVREAVRALAALGIVDVGNGRKPRVAAASAFPFIMALAHSTQTGQITVRQIWEARSCIEVKTATLAADNRTEVQAARLLELARQMRDLQDNADAMADIEIEFHQLIAVASRNILFEHLLASFAPLIESASHSAWDIRSTPKDEEEELVKIHLAIAIAIASGDRKGAADAMQLHFDRAIGILIQAHYEPS